MPSWLDLLLSGQAPQFPQGQPPSPDFVPQRMAIAPTFAQAPQMAQDVAAGIADPLLKAGNYLGGIMQGSQQFSWPETIQHGAALAMAMAPGPKGERLAAGAERGLARVASEAAGGQLAGQIKPPIDVGTVPGGIRAYHGSPYDFPAFDLSKIGTGEGAQAYGHGLYFAENEDVARNYKYGPDWKWSKELAEEMKHGKMYEVNIKAQPEQFLDWEKPLSQQPQAVQDLLAKHPQQQSHQVYQDYLKARGEELPGAGIYRMLQGTGGPDQAAAALREAGIPGIRYLDQGSRGSGQGTHNYVVFNDQLIDILRKYGLIGALGGSMSAPYFAPQGQQQ